MESILEKITLYDILGYFFPGSIFLIIILFGGMQEETFGLMERWSNHMAVLYLAFVFAGYLAGVLLSELNEFIQFVCKRLISVIRESRLAKKKFMARILENGSQTTEMIFFFQNQLAKALVMSGCCEDEKTIKKKFQNKEGICYKKYIYGIIQGSQDYKRLHSYASACVMYKNIAMGILADSLILYFRFHINEWFCVGGILVSVLLSIRGRRFMEKKNQYALIWFMEKYKREI